MRVGVVLPTLGGDAPRVLRTARRVADLGYDGVFVPDHLGRGAGPLPLEAFSTLAAIAASVPGIRLGTLVARATIRPIAMLARLAVAVDAMADGRFVLGLGAGDAGSAREDAAAGLPVLDADARYAHLAETLAALGALFRGEPWPGGSSVPAIAGTLLPVPTRAPEIWVGGASEAIVRIATAGGVAWNGWGLAPERFSSIARSVVAAGSEPTWSGIVAVAPTSDAVEDLLARRRATGLPAPHVTGTPADLRVWLDGLAADGVTWVVAVIAGGEAGLETVAREVLGR